MRAGSLPARLPWLLPTSLLLAFGTRERYNRAGSTLRPGYALGTSLGAMAKGSILSPNATSVERSEQAPPIATGG